MSQTQEQLRAMFNAIDGARRTTSSDICWCSVCTAERFEQWCAQNSASVEPVVEAPPVALTERERKLAEFADYHVAVIPDDGVTDMGDYILWHTYDGMKRFVAGNIAQALPKLSHMRDIQGASYVDAYKRDPGNLYYAYPSDKPLMVKGMFKADSGSVVHYTPSPLGHLLQVKVDPWGDVRANRIYAPLGAVVAPLAKRGVVPASLRDVDRNHLARFIDKVFSLRRGDGLVSHVQYNNAIRIAGRVSQEPPATAPRWRGVRLDQFVAHRDTLRNIGRIVNYAEHHDAGDMLDAIHGYLTESSACSNLVRNAVRAWNDRSDYTISQASCGHWEWDDSCCETAVDGAVCQTCFDEHYVVPENRERYYHQSNLYLHDDGNYYTYSEYDSDDHDSSVGGLVRGYSTNVLETLSRDHSIVPSSFGEFLMGVELEVVPNNGRRSLTVKDTNATLCPGYAILKRDGSLAQGGFEIVTAPRGLKEHIERFSKWTPHKALRAWDPGCCGLHVHISSQAFSPATLGKFIEFINAPYNVRLISSIAGRHPDTDSQAREYCQTEGGLSLGNPKKTLDGKSDNRYHMVNTTNLGEHEAERLGIDMDTDEDDRPINTVELRIFRASLKKERLLAQIEFAHAAVMFCRATSMRELRRGHFLKWLQKAAGLYPNLARWFGVKANTAVIDEAPKAQALAEV